MSQNHNVRTPAPMIGHFPRTFNYPGADFALKWVALDQIPVLDGTSMQLLSKLSHP